MSEINKVEDQVTKIKQGIEQAHIAGTARLQTADMELTAGSVLGGLTLTLAVSGHAFLSGFSAILTAGSLGAYRKQSMLAAVHFNNEIMARNTLAQHELQQAANEGGQEPPEPTPIRPAG